MKLWLFLAVATVAAATGPAAARAQSWYLGAEGGWTHLESTDNPRTNRTAFREDFSSGFNAGARTGYRLGPWRFEAEFSYRKNNESSLVQTVPVTLAFPRASGDRHGYAEMANLIYDLSLGWPVTPHIGAGVGADEMTQNAATLVGSTHSSDTVFAYQAIAGVEWNINPAVALDLDYRYFATLAPHFTTDTGGVGIRSSYETHNILASLIYRFGPLPTP